MNDVRTSAISHVAVERALTEFRSGRPVVFLSRSAILAMPVDGCDVAGLKKFRLISNSAPLRLAISARRACALGIESERALTVDLTKRTQIDEIYSLAFQTSFSERLQTRSAGPAVRAALDLAKLSGRLPSLLVAGIERQQCLERVMELTASSVRRFRQHLADSLRIVASSTIPLEGDVAADLVVFRDAIGGAQIALIVGEPDLSRTVLVRIHSSCVTGDVFGSRRCDCGDQLKLALRRMRRTGGIILYLEQEGRGLGLANKIRAYRLQDLGLDTIDANGMLGFEGDERDYGVAARMLQLLGCSRVALLTNNPAKHAALSRHGLETSETMPILAPITKSNRRYLTTMAKRAGHRLAYER
jgi:GTP cyclohydrolase II